MTADELMEARGFVCQPLPGDVLWKVWMPAGADDAWRALCSQAVAAAQLLAERDRLRAELAAAERLLADLPRLYREATDAEKQRIVRAMVERIYTRGEQVVAIQPTPEAYHLLTLRWLRTRRGPSAEPAITRQPAGYWLSPPATPLSVLAAAVG